MSQTDVQKSHELKALASSPPLGSPEDVLRVIVAIAIDRETAASCLGHPADTSIARWPSTLYRVLARTALQSPDVWWRTSMVLDRTLHDAMLPYRNRATAEIAEAFSQGRDSLDGEELAALLWSLFRRRPDDLVTERVRVELRVGAARRLELCATS